MALKRGFCTHCEGDEKLRLFEVNRGADNCHCPYCGRLMQPKEAIENYHYLISSYLKKASKYLFESTEYLLAYQTFAHIIDIDDSIKVAYFGRILSLVYLSTLRTSKIHFAFLLHRQEVSKFHYQETANEYYHFLLLLLDALDIYENRIKKRLMSRGVFYDADCIVLFIKRIDEIRSYKDFIASEADFFIESNKEQFKEIVDRVKVASEQYEAIFTEQYQTYEGFTYAFNSFGNDGLPTIMVVEDKPQKIARRTKPINLYPKDKKQSPIRDSIYLNNLPLSRLVAVSIPLAIALLIIGIASVVIGLIIQTTVLKFVLFGAAMLLASSSILLFILHFSFKNRLKKTYYNGTNPFIFK